MSALVAVLAGGRGRRERAGRPVVAVGCDMPFVTAALLGRLAAWLPALREALAAEAPPERA